MLSVTASSIVLNISHFCFLVVWVMRRLLLDKSHKILEVSLNVFFPARILSKLGI